MPCIDNAYPDREHPIERSMWATIYPATQNLLLRARSLGLGAAMTTFHRYGEPEVRERFGIPESVGIGASVVVGYPMGRFGPISRKPIEEVTHWGRWGQLRGA
jgi:nitroreductase